jgi:hypothetical protein
MQALEQLKTYWGKHEGEPGWGEAREEWGWTLILVATEVRRVARYPREVDSLGPSVPPPCFHPRGTLRGQLDFMKDLWLANCGEGQPT